MNKLTKEVVLKHLYSFVKTYATVFIGALLFADLQQQDIFELAVVVTAAKASLISALRNIYKFLTEGDMEKLS